MASSVGKFRPDGQAAFLQETKDVLRSAIRRGNVQREPALSVVPSNRFGVLLNKELDPLQGGWWSTIATDDGRVQGKGAVLVGSSLPDEESHNRHIRRILGHWNVHGEGPVVVRRFEGFRTLLDQEPNDCHRLLASDRDVNGERAALARSIQKLWSLRDKVLNDRERRIFRSRHRHVQRVGTVP